jgi:hypothetical protein
VAALRQNKAREGFAICPTGAACEFLSILPSKNISVFQKPESWVMHPASLAEGRIAIVTRREAGMRWTRRHHETGDANADGEAVWSWRPDAGAKLATMLFASRRRR